MQGEEQLSAFGYQLSALVLERSMISKINERQTRGFSNLDD
jgi:hypothetical protein